MSVYAGAIFPVPTELDMARHKVCQQTSRFHGAIRRLRRGFVLKAVLPTLIFHADAWRQLALLFAHEWRTELPKREWRAVEVVHRHHRHDVVELRLAHREEWRTVRAQLAQREQRLNWLFQRRYHEDRLTLNELEELAQRRSLKAHVAVPAAKGRHAAESQPIDWRKASPVITAALAATVVMALFATILPASGRQASRSAVSGLTKADLNLPRWMPQYFSYWGPLVQKVSQDPRVAIPTVNGAVNYLEGRTVAGQYVQGQERLLYLCMLLGTGGNPAAQQGACPVSNLAVKKLSASISENTGQSFNVQSGDREYNLLVIAAYRINRVLARLLSEPKKVAFYASLARTKPEFGPSAMAEDFAMAWVKSYPASYREQYAQAFRKLYNDWTFVRSAQFKQLGKQAWFAKLLTAAKSEVTRRNH